MAVGGYVSGPTLINMDPLEPLDGGPSHYFESEHYWERVSVLTLSEDQIITERKQVVRCAGCHIERCGGVNEDNPCILAKGHGGKHYPLDEV
jgi:hypothetical protein